MKYQQCKPLNCQQVWERGAAGPRWTNEMGQKPKASFN